MSPNRKNQKVNVLHIFKPILIFMLFCGYNFGYNKCLIARIILKFYFVFLMVIFSYSTMTCCDDQEISFIWSLLEYIVFVSIMTFYDSRITVYFHKITTIDMHLRINYRHYYYMRNKVIFFIVLVWLLRLGFTMLYCQTYECYNFLFLFLVYEFSLLALDTNRVWRFFLFEEIWRRLKILRERIEEVPEADYYLYVKGNKAMKENKIKFCLFIYRSIADLLDLITPELNASLFISVVCSLPKLILNVYRILLVIDKQLPYEALGFMVTHIAQISLFIFTPCIVVEMYSAEVEKMRLFLMHQLFIETDPKAKEDLQLFLSYTHQRNFHYRIWRVIPMDLRLPVEMINLCTTYVIVIVNFTKVFDS